MSWGDGVEGVTDQRSCFLLVAGLGQGRDGGGRGRRKESFTGKGAAALRPKQPGPWRNWTPSQVRGVRRGVSWRSVGS